MALPPLMRCPAGVLPVAVALMVGLITGCSTGGAPGDAAKGSGQVSSAPANARTFTLSDPPVPDGEPVLLTRHGFGSEVAAKPINVDGSYSIYAACHGGSEITVVSKATKAETKVVCSGYTSRFRYLTQLRTESWEIKADKDQELVFRMVDAVQPT